MALWHFMQGEEPYSWEENGRTVSSWDDGFSLIPGDADFSSEAADQKASSFSAIPPVVAVYTGTPNYAAAQDAIAKAAADSETALAAAAQIDAMLNPITPQQQAINAMNAQFDALLAAAPDRASDIATLRAEALAKIAHT